MLTAKARAFLEGRSYVTVADIKRLAFPILRHRLILYDEYSSMRVTTDQIIQKIMDTIDAPME
jgi:MoxR-like ATPase